MTESETESISEHIPSNIECSVSDIDNDNIQKQAELSVDKNLEESFEEKSLNIPLQENVNVELSDSLSLNLDTRIISDLLEESPIPLPLSSDVSKDGQTQENKSQPGIQSECSDKSQEVPDDESPKNKYSDSLNEELGDNSDKPDDVNTPESMSDKVEDPIEHDSLSGSEEIIKLDIRGQGVPKYPRPSSNFIFGLPTQSSSIIDSTLDPNTLFTNLLSPILVKAESSVKIEEIFDEPDDQTSPKDSSLSNKLEQSDLLIEEMTVDESKEKDEELIEVEMASSRTQPKSLAPEETVSLSTLTTDYKTICEEYFTKVYNNIEEIALHVLL